MNTISIVIITIFVFILGTIMMLRPTPRQRKQNQFRSKAISQGLQIGYIKSKQANKNNHNNLISYSKRLIAQDDEHSDIDSISEASYKRLLNSPTFDIDHTNSSTISSDNRAIQQQLQRLPLSVSAVSYRDQSWSIVWNESGTMEDLDTIIDILDYLAINKIKP